MRRKRQLFLRNVIKYEPREWTEKNKREGRKGRWKLACTHCHLGTMVPITGIFPWSEDHLICNRCDSTRAI